MQVYRGFIRNQSNGNGTSGGNIISDFKNDRYFRALLSFLRKSQWHNGRWHDDYQNRRLRDLIEFSAKRVPFYRDYINDLGADISELNSRDDLRNLPVIREIDLVENTERFLSFNSRGGWNRLNPSDHEAESRIALDRQTLMEEGALIARHCENSGFRIGAPQVSFVETIPGRERDEFYYDKTSNRFYLSAANLGRRNLPDYCAKIKALKTGFVFGYPGSLEAFADYVLEWEIDIKFQGVITHGEVLSAEVREKIERAFETKVYDLYRYRLPVAGMGQCHYCDGYHLFSEFCIIELVDFEGRPVREKNGLGRIVVTNLTNRALPLIRFETGDIAVYDGDECDCGMGTPKIVKEVVGTRDDILISSDGGYVRPDILRDALSRAGYSRPGYQLVQKNRYDFKLTLVRDPDYSAEKLDRINECLLDKLGENTRLTIKMVNDALAEKLSMRPFIRQYEACRA